MNFKKEVYLQRRNDLVAAIKKEFPEKLGIVLLIGSFEQDRHLFRQNSTFYYFSGVEEPGSVLMIDLDDSSILFIPATQVNRALWLEGCLTADQKCAEKYGFSKIEYLGQPQGGYHVSPLAAAGAYEILLKKITDGGTLFTCVPANVHQYIQEKFLLDRLKSFDSAKFENIIDISPIVARMRRKKSIVELEQMYRAVEITMAAQEAAAHSLGNSVSEAHVHASIEYMFTEHGACAAFPSIVGSGKQSTVLHYNQNNQIMQDGDLVVVDIGAELDYYCADLTRTYPVSGKFTSRQKEVYTAVLETQEHIASLAKPGMWINNKEKPEQSLQHLAVAFLEQKGFGKYFIHGIGHFLGMDVHDVGNSAEPLQEGDVITIEPGVYISEERIGVRIEDNYWLVKDGVECLSDELPKSVEDVERMAQASLHDIPVESNQDDLEIDEDIFGDDEDLEIQ